MGDDTTCSGVGDENWSECGEAVETASDIPGISTGTVFELVANRHRRAVLAYLEHTDDGQASISDLAAYVSQHPRTDNDPTSVRTHLHHVHLPKLARTDVVDYDPEAGTVQYVGHPLVEACIDLAEANERERERS